MRGKDASPNHGVLNQPLPPRQSVYSPGLPQARLDGGEGGIDGLLRRPPCGLRGYAAPSFSPPVVALRAPSGGPESNPGCLCTVGSNFANANGGERLNTAVELLDGGEGGIRTHGTVNRTLDFESSPFDHSGTSPLEAAHYRPEWAGGHTPAAKRLGAPSRIRYRHRK